MGTNGGDGASVFAQFIDRPEREPVRPPTPQAAGRLLTWIQQKWKQPVIRAKNIYQFGPGPTRDKERTLKLTGILERRGYLVPMKTRRYDTKMWRITIGD
jgi:hypothetical protein